MAYSFTDSASYLLTSESVTEGHPDKLCDQISDSVLDSVLERDPEGRVACEASVTNGLVVVMGEITTDTYVDIPLLVRETLRDAGYTDAGYGIDYKSCGVVVSVQEQSKDISGGVSRSLEVRQRGISNSDREDMDRIGAGDQGMMVGFACNETPELMPLPMSLSHKLCRRLAQVRKEGLLPYLRPDGKSQVTVEYSYGVPKRVHTVVVSAQHAPEADPEMLAKDVMELVIREVVPEELMDQQTKYYINPSGRFAVGGPMADTGLTGRKILVDTYGGNSQTRRGRILRQRPDQGRPLRSLRRQVRRQEHSGGGPCRQGRNTGVLRHRGRPAISISIETFGTGKVDDSLIHDLAVKHFDLRPAAIIEDLRLRRPIYQKVASYGHFGRDDLDLPWESTDKAALLRAEAGLR